MNSPAYPATQGQGHVTPDGSHLLMGICNTPQSSSNNTLPVEKHNCPGCVSFETECICIPILKCAHSYVFTLEIPINDCGKIEKKKRKKQNVQKNQDGQNIEIGRGNRNGE